MSTIPIWGPQPPTWSPEEQSLLPQTVVKPNDISLTSLIDKSNSFPRPFPIDTNRCKNLKSSVSEEILERNINSSYPLVHENALNLFAKFILHKRKYGSPIEKSFYEKMDLLQFVNRLLNKRAVSFLGKKDTWTLINGQKGSDGWQNVGTSNEKKPLILENCLSYDEIKLSAFLSVSSYTHFINIGDRKNMAVVDNNRASIQEEGVIVGIIGPRLVKDEVMEYQELIISKKQNTKEKGYGKRESPSMHQLFSNFYDEESLQYGDVPKDKKRFTLLKNDEILDNYVYYKRLSFTFDTLLLEANQRACEKNTFAYIHVVGIGLGVWKRSPVQNKLFMDFCGHRIKLIGSSLTHVSDICFAYITHDSCLEYKNGDLLPIEGHPLKGIKLHMCKREPHSKLTGADEKKLLVVSYAWDGNAFPGNEYWMKKLGSSGDSAAASSTQISELHNCFINGKVCAENLRVVSGGKLLWVGEYLEGVKRGTKRELEQ